MFCSHQEVMGFQVEPFLLAFLLCHCLLCLGGSRLLAVMAQSSPSPPPTWRDA